MSPRSYKGDVVFVQGVHYPAKDDEHDLSRPLRTDGEGGWRDADDDEALHNATNHVNELELEIGGES